MSYWVRTAMAAAPTPLDQLLAVLKTPSLAGDLALRPDVWNEVKRLAEIHRFSGLLAQVSSAWLPSTEREWRDQVLMQHHRKHAARLAALRRLLEAFGNEGIACISLKGPLLAERFYPQPFLRPSNDLDLLIPEDRTGTAARLMQRLGFQLEELFPWDMQRRLSHHLNFGSTGWSPRVEVHYYATAGAIEFSSVGLMERSVVWRSPSGFESRVLSPADEAFYSCVHAAHHAFHRLRWLYDSITIARSLSPEDRASVRNLSVRHDQTGPMVAASIAAQEFFGESLELDCMDFVVPRLLRQLSSRDVRRMVVRVEGNTVTLAEKVGYKLDLCRMAGSPLKAASLLWRMGIREIQMAGYRFRRAPGDTNILSRTLPD